MFFAGPVDSEGLLASVRVCARGHEGAVPAVFEGLDARDIVIHNHPGGDVTPSDADLELAVIYSHNGHGVYIVDNEVAFVYVVVEAFREKDRRRLDSAELSAVLGADGPIAASLPDYEMRPQQVEMLEWICSSFNENGIAVVEAPTGGGEDACVFVAGGFLGGAKS